MLSILIPTYNYNITRLVATLHQQAMDSYVDFEIIVMEDGATTYTDENKAISELNFCRHIILPQNIGRSAIRNKLADTARYEHLLFMDCDAEICSPHFIEKYICFCKEECVVMGGTAYDPNEQDPRFSLRLKYGRQREARSALERSKREHTHQTHSEFHTKECNPIWQKGERLIIRSNFTTFNFLISRCIFNQVRFDENIRGYGHEDTLFGHRLREIDCEFLHIENPLIHKGLDDNKTFLKKTEEGTRNLFLLYQTGHYPFLINESKLLASYVKLSRMHLVRILGFKFTLCKHLLRWMLCRKSPSLLLYDLYKILFLCKTSQTNDKLSAR